MSANSLLLSTSATPLSSSALLPPSTAESATSSANPLPPGHARWLRARRKAAAVHRQPPGAVVVCAGGRHLLPALCAPSTASSFALGAYSRDTFTWSRRSLPRPSTAATDTGRFSLADSSVSDPRHPALRAEGADAEWRPPPPRATPKPAARRSKAAFSAGAFRREEPLGAAHHLGPGHYSAAPRVRPAAARPSRLSPRRRSRAWSPIDPPTATCARRMRAGRRRAAAPRRRAFAPRGPDKARRRRRRGDGMGSCRRRTPTRSSPAGAFAR